MAVTLTYDDDLKPFAPNLDEAQAELMIVDALALAARAAPCITGDELDETAEAAAKAILRAAILRWHESGQGSVQQLMAGPFQMSTYPQQRRSLFWPSEINELASLCTDGRSGNAFTIDTTPVAFYDDEGS